MGGLGGAGGWGVGGLEMGRYEAGVHNGMVQAVGVSGVKTVHASQPADSGSSSS